MRGTTSLEARVRIVIVVVYVLHAAQARGEQPNAGPGGRAAPSASGPLADLERLREVSHLDGDGRVPPFGFVDLPWRDALLWLADVSESRLDWRELPEDGLSIATRRPHTVDEVRGLLRRELLLRGFALVERGGALSVFKTEALDPSMIPRASEEGLYELGPYELAKVSLEAPAGVVAADFAEDVRQLLTPGARVVVLASSNRVLLIDAVANLRAASALASEEQASRDGRFREFPLQHVRAERAAAILSPLLGLADAGDQTEEDLRLKRDRIDALSRLQRSGTDVHGMIEEEFQTDTRVVVNARRNALLVAAPPATMRLVERMIRAIDAPSASEKENVAGDAERPLRRYVLATTNAESLAAMLKDVGGLDPRTELRADVGTRSLFVQGCAEDHARVASLLERLDRPERSFDVIQLRRLSADAVAATVYRMMAGERQHGGDRRRRRDEGEDETGGPRAGFRVDADVENNRLLLWANGAELTEVKGLLAKLGEITGEDGAGATVRVLRPVDGASVDELLERIRQAWPTVSDRALTIEGDQSSTSSAGATKREHDNPPKDRSVQSAMSPRAGRPLFTGADPGSRPGVRAHSAALAGSTDRARSEAAPREDHAVHVAPQGDGRLIVRAPDATALDAFEELFHALAPAQPRFRVFTLEHAPVFSVWLTLTEFFEDDLAPDSGPAPTEQEQRRPRLFAPPRPGLSQRERLRIIYDSPSSTILVAGATPSQLSDIERLVEQYDRPAPAKSIKTRRTTTIELRYAKAAEVAAALKDVYRDLLSSRDKEFEGEDQKQAAFAASTRTVILYGEGGVDGGPRKTSPFRVRFEGSLSLGVDERSNLLMVSADEPLFQSVVDMARQLDQPPAPVTTRVLPIGDVSAGALRDALSGLGPSVSVGNGERRPQADRERGEEVRRDREDDQEGKEPPQPTGKRPPEPPARERGAGTDAASPNDGSRRDGGNHDQTPRAQDISASKS